MRTWMPMLRVSNVLVKFNRQMTTDVRPIRIKLCHLPSSCHINVRTQDVAMSLLTLWQQDYQLRAV